MKDLIEAFNSWFGMQVTLIEEDLGPEQDYKDVLQGEPAGAVLKGQLKRIKRDLFIDFVVQVRGFLKDYDDGMIAHMGDASAVNITPSKVTLYSDGAFQEGKAIEVMYSLLHSIKEFNQLSFDARGELAVTVAGLLMDSVQENL